MRVFMAAVAMSVLCSGSGFAAEMTGYISDDDCATKSAKAAKAADWVKADVFESCVKKCMKEGSSMVFVTEDNKILRFDAASISKATPLMGHRVKLTGTASDGILKVDSIASVDTKTGR